MSERPSATIIAFPRPLAGGMDSPDRLRRALASLEQALAEQRGAVAAWRENLGRLRGSVQGLGESLGAFQSRLGVLSDDVGGLNQEARRLEAWAEGALARGLGATAQP